MLRRTGLAIVCIAVASSWVFAQATAAGAGGNNDRMQHRGRSLQRLGKDGSQRRTRPARKESSQGRCGREPSRSGRERARVSSSVGRSVCWRRWIGEGYPDPV